MRRVYYSYALSLVSVPIFWQGMFLGGVTLLLANWLHVASIINNFLALPARETPQFAWSAFFGAFSNGETMTALVFIAFIIAAALVTRHFITVFFASPRFKFIRLSAKKPA